jgi:hypothetical protein
MRHKNWNLLRRIYAPHPCGAYEKYFGKIIFLEKIVGGKQ